MNRYGSSFLLTLFLYSAIIATLVFSNTSIQAIQTTPPKQNQNLKIQIISKKAEVKEKKLVKKEQPKKKAIEKPKPKKKPKKKKPLKKNKINKPKKQPETKKKIQKEKQNTPKPQSIAKPVKQKPLAKVDEKLNLEKIDAQKQIYFSKIKQTLDKNKTYPRVAVKRAIEGSVKVQFTLTQYGELISFEILDGQRIFKKSIAKAIQKSFPIKPPSNIFKENLDLFVTLNYKLY